MEIETPVLLAYAIEDFTDIFRISGGGGLKTPNPPSRYATDSSQVIFKRPTLSASSDEVVLSACMCVLNLQGLIFCLQSFLMFAAIYVVIIKATVDAGGLEILWEIAVNGSRIEFDK